MLEEVPDFECKPKARAWPLWLAVGAGLLGVLGVLWLNYKPVPPIVYQATQCPAKIAQVAAVLIDVTNALEGEQPARIVKEMRQLCKSVPQYGRIDLYVLDKREKPQLLFSMCSPGDGSGGSWISSNEWQSRLKWERLFFAKVEMALQTAMKAEGSLHSPLMKAINDVCTRSFSGGDAMPGNTLIVVSDMLQNTGELNHYRGGVAMNFAEVVASPYYANVKPTNASGVRAQVFYLRRANKGHLQSALHKDFWRSFFKDCGATVDIADI